MLHVMQYKQTSACAHARVAKKEPSHSSNNYLELGGNNLWSLDLSTYNATLLKVWLNSPCLLFEYKRIPATDKLSIGLTYEGLARQVHDIIARCHVRWQIFYNLLVVARWDLFTGMVFWFFAGINPSVRIPLSCRPFDSNSAPIWNWGIQFNFVAFKYPVHTTRVPRLLLRCLVLSWPPRVATPGGVQTAKRQWPTYGIWIPCETHCGIRHIHIPR